MFIYNETVSSHFSKNIAFKSLHNILKLNLNKYIKLTDFKARLTKINRYYSQAIDSKGLK